jgi:hypothetical protein
MLAVQAGCGAVPRAGSGGAACAGPTLFAEPARAAPGEDFVVRGLAFGTYQCNDVGVNGEVPESDPPVPARNVRLVFRQGEREWDLGSANAGSELSFEERVRVPDEASPGPARVVAANGPLGPAGVAFPVLGAEADGPAVGAAGESSGQCISPEAPCEDDPGASAPNVLGLTDAECGELVREVSLVTGAELPAPVDQIRYCLHALGSRGEP